MEGFQSSKSLCPKQPLSLCGSQAMRVELEEMYQTDPLELVTCSYASGLDEGRPVSGNVKGTCGKYNNETLTLRPTDNSEIFIKSKFSITNKDCSDSNIVRKCNDCGITIEFHEQMEGKSICTVCQDQRKKRNENDTIFVCDICSKVFRTKLTLSKHLKYHSRTNTLKCSVCNLKFNNHKALQKHFKLMHKENTNLKCTFCKTAKQYKSVTTLLNHINKMHAMASNTYKETKYSITQCELRADTCNENELNNRIVKVENIGCKICKLEFKDQRELTYHLDSHNEVDCKPKCKKRNASRDVSLCSYCGKVFSTVTLLSQHIRITHLRVKKHKCKHCGKCFSTTSGLRNHVEAIHDKRKFQCALCGGLLSSSNGLQSHMRKHANRNVAPTVGCPVCPKLFRHKKNVERHMRSHTGETPYKCSHCPREFTLEWNLIQHERLHTGEKRYVCDKCGKAFTHNVSRKNHMKYHKDETGEMQV